MRIDWRDGRTVAFGECMVEVSADGVGGHVLGYGGDTLNTAVYMARLGIEVAYATAVGDDPYSDRMLAGWREDGIATDLVIRLPGRMPGLYSIETDPDGERHFYYWREASAARDYLAVMAPRVMFDGARLFYFSGISLAILRPEHRHTLIGALQGARLDGVKVAFDMNVRLRLWPDLSEARTWYERALAQSDIVIAGRDDLVDLDLAGEDGGGRWLEGLRPGQEVVLRTAPDRCEVVLDRERHRVDLGPPAPVVVDTTGAGDSFSAGYLAARLKGRAPVEALAVAHRLASMVVAHRGAIVPREVIDRDVVFAQPPAPAPQA